MSNHLANETSPYLLQHAENPVEWFPWGDAAFRKAAAEGKPIFLSIGYSTCHWCHVMEGDSFEKEDVADVLNKHYVAIKVDREERPDVDAFYLKALQAMNQRGGWPLSMVLTDEGKPFWGGTFFPREQFKNILNRIQEIWHSEAHVLKDKAFELTEHLKIREEEFFASTGDVDLGIVEAFLQSKVESFDPHLGGFGSAPKFPPAMALMVLLRFPEHRAMATKTLDAMARGGMRDHVGGGFHRYSVDDKWLLPHFEKMLYDNALLTLAYTEGYQVAHNEDYRDVAISTLDYVLRDMTSADGGFYSAEDADSEKTEGKFYVWRAADFAPELLARVTQYFELKAEGNFEISKRVEELEAAAGLKAVTHANILHHIGKKELPRDESYQKLLVDLRVLRDTRIRPGLDDKILTSWNGLMIGALAKASRVFGAEKFGIAAEKALKFILEKHIEGDKLLRTSRGGFAKQPAFLEDYANLIFAHIELYQSTLNPQYLVGAIGWQNQQDAYFLDRKAEGYFDSEGSDIRIPLRSKELMDDATPGGNAMSAWNLARLFKLTGKLLWRTRCNALLERSAELMQKYPAAFPMMNLALMEMHGKSLVIAGDFDAAKLNDTLTPITWVQYHPALLQSCPILHGKGPKEAGAQFYLCTGDTCQLPTSDFGRILREIKA
ncbi:MAG: thioredoxin domain-containing protein [Chitinophagaceae bacterium]|nr:thioredoxin domain-containing protein [Oligoflexus sp.]